MWLSILVNIPLRMIFHFKRKLFQIPFLMMIYLIHQSKLVIIGKVPVIQSKWIIPIIHFIKHSFVNGTWNTDFVCIRIHVHLHMVLTNWNLCRHTKQNAQITRTVANVNMVTNVSLFTKIENYTNLVTVGHHIETVHILAQFANVKIFHFKSFFLLFFLLTYNLCSLMFLCLMNFVPIVFHQNENWINF